MLRFFIKSIFVNNEFLLINTNNKISKIKYKTEESIKEYIYLYNKELDEEIDEELEYKVKILKSLFYHGTIFAIVKINEELPLGLIIQRPSKLPIFIYETAKTSKLDIIENNNNLYLFKYEQYNLKGNNVYKCYMIRLGFNGNIINSLK